MKNFLKKSLVIFPIICFIIFSYLFFSFQNSKVVEAGIDDNVSGYAWSENIGWISFNSTSSGGGIDYGVDVDISTGDFSGYAWSENIGWISFESPIATSIEITSCVELQNIQNDLNADYILMNDIDCSDTVNWNWNEDRGEFMGFNPIGGDFNGILDGMGYKIIGGLYINQMLSEDEDIGLFADIGSSGVVKNLGLENVDINGFEDLGVLAGENYGTINNCYSTGNIFGLSNKVGGLVGINAGYIVNSYSSVIVTDTDSYSLVNAGGLVGTNDLGGEITNCYVTGSVSGETYVGGLVSSNYGLVSNSYATGNVDGDSGTGGLVGENYGVIYNSYAIGDVGNSGAEGVGGLVGRNMIGGTISNSYATGNVSGNEDIGGLIGDNLSTISEVYWNNHLDNPDECYSGGDEGCTAIDNDEPYFYDADNLPMDQWDFIDIWLENPFDHPTLIQFLDSSEPPSAPNYYACLDLPGAGQVCDGVGDYDVSGWARACSVFISGCSGILKDSDERGGWDGWLKLRGAGYGVSLDVSSYPYEFNGWAWGDTVIGWLSFNCLNQGICGISNYRVVLDINFAPDLPDPASETLDYCGIGMPQIALGIKLILGWTYSDPEGDPQTSYEVWIDDDSNFTGAKFNNIVNSSSESYVVNLDYDDDSDWLSELSWGTTYYWKVRVKDNYDNWSVFSTVRSFTMPAHAYPQVDFNYLPLNPILNELVLFTDNSKCYDAANTEFNCKDLGTTSYQWDFDYDTGVDDTTIGDTTTTYTVKDFYDVWLEVTHDGLICSRIKMVSVELYLPSPSWKEILP